MIYAIGVESKRHAIYTKGAPLGTEDFRLVNADDDGWIRWHGEECPLPYDSRCDAETIVMNYQGVLAKTLQWGKVTRYRPILDAEAKPETPEWYGIGKPPVGCECELLRGTKWVPVEITGKGKQVTVFRRLYNFSLEEITEASASEFRPIRSIDYEAVGAMADVYRKAPHFSVYESIKCVYAAIRDGKIPGVKLEDAS